MIGWALGAAAALITGLVVLHSSSPKPVKKTAPPVPGTLPVVTQPTVTTLLPLLAASVFPPLGYTLLQTDKPHFANATYLSGTLSEALRQADLLYNANYQQAGVPIWRDGIVIVDPAGLVIANYRKPGAPPDVLPGYAYQSSLGI